MCRIHRRIRGFLTHAALSARPSHARADGSAAAEVLYDHVSGHRFRHGTRFLRWRPDKAPRQCTFDQLQSEARPSRLLANIV